MKEYYSRKAGACLRYQDFPGEGTPILWIHGLGCAGSFDYPEVVSQIGFRGRRSIVVDLLGAGYSDKPLDFPYHAAAHAEVLKAFTEALALKSFVLYGHSLGGSVAIELAALCMGQVEHLVLSEANLDPSEAGTSSYKIAQYSEEAFIETGFDEMLDACRKSGNTMWAASMANWSPVAVHRFARSGAQGGTPPWRQQLDALSVPKSFIFGERSLPHKDYDAFKRQGMRIETVPNAGHLMAWENPEGLAQAVLRCLEAE